MSKLRSYSLIVAVLVLPFLAGCIGGDSGPTEPSDIEDPAPPPPPPPPPPPVTLGATSIVIAVNPGPNSTSTYQVASVPQPITVSVSGGPSAVTNSRGIAVLSPVPEGTLTLTLSGSSDVGDIVVDMVDGELKEVMANLQWGAATKLKELSYPSDGTITEITPGMPNSVINDALAQSNTTVFIRAGSYPGNLTVSGTNVTVFCEGLTAGGVTLDGDVQVDGDGCRIRAAHVTGDLTAVAADFSLTFSHVEGTAGFSGSEPVLLHNDFCGSVSVTGFNPTAMGNQGIPPYGSPASCP